MNAIVRSVTGLLVAVAAGQFVAASAAAGESCSRCGCEGWVCKVCRPVHTTRLVEVTCWDVVCEEICLPGRITCDCRDGGGIACPDGKTRTRRKLMRKTFLKEVPVVVWVVEYVCGPCARGEESDNFHSQEPSHANSPDDRRPIAEECDVD